MAENHEQKKSAALPEPKVMPSALIEVKNTADSGRRELGTPRVMPSAIETIQKGKKN